jgi:hypothetical protein
MGRAVNVMDSVETLFVNVAVVKMNVTRPNTLLADVNDRRSW